jgi:hypothetical protein
MKTYIPYSLILAAASCGLAFGAATAYTTPVGYVTQTMPANASTLLGLTVQQPTIAAGVLTASSSTSVTDSKINFTTLLGASSATSPTYILELPGGVVQEIKTWSGSDLTTPDNISSFVTNGTTIYKLRKASTIADVFGATNSAGLTSTATGNLGTYDAVLVLNAAGTAFTSVFYYDDGTFHTWYDTNFNDMTNLPLVYPDAFYVRRIAGVSKDLVVSGEVKTTPTTLIIHPGNTFAGTVNPAGSTLGNSGLQNFVDPDNGAANDKFDKILIQQPNGAYTAYNYYNDGTFATWYDANFVDATTVPLSPGVVIQSQTVAPKNATINAPVIGN